MSTGQPNFYAIIPATVRYDKDLTANAKLLYGEITALCNEKGYCWASNDYFSNLYQVSKRTVISWINQLVDKGYLNRHLEYKKGTKEVSKRYLSIPYPATRVSYPSDEIITSLVTNNSHPSEENFTDLVKKISDPSEENFTDNNTINITSNNTINNIYSKSDKNNKKDIKSDFEKLWQLYPNRKGKDRAFKAYANAIKKGVTNKEIQDGIVAYKQEIAYKQTETRYIKHGGTWFNNRCWNDDYEAPPSVKQAIVNEVEVEEELSPEEAKQLLEGLIDEEPR